ncbi:hypothetical protein M422DRAFT_255059 [Sphaerobolus stellatus SS14]|uniref:Uncharacterized protein n=1 Tax=Sphaerobolus stellatus (strain SS14) TaxID=990650 RepID=A0A0C9V4C1_SPHS4|nr:hypothetical protein M422DRAFT_255059 [Sphaerobolus stellatus SS14]
MGLPPYYFLEFDNTIFLSFQSSGTLPLELVVTFPYPASNRWEDEQTVRAFHTFIQLFLQEEARIRTLMVIHARVSSLFLIFGSRNHPHRLEYLESLKIVMYKEDTNYEGMESQLLDIPKVVRLMVKPATLVHKFRWVSMKSVEHLSISGNNILHEKSFQDGANPTSGEFVPLSIELDEHRQAADHFQLPLALAEQKLSELYEGYNNAMSLITPIRRLPEEILLSILIEAFPRKVPSTEGPIVFAELKGSFNQRNRILLVVVASWFPASSSRVAIQLSKLHPLEYTVPPTILFLECSTTLVAPMTSVSLTFANCMCYAKSLDMDECPARTSNNMLKVTGPLTHGVPSYGEYCTNPDITVTS